MTMKAQSPSNVYCLPHQEGYLIYAPFARRVAYVNAACAAQIQRYLTTGNIQEVHPDVIAKLGGVAWLEPPQLPFALPPDRHYHPCEATLFLTNRCNLRCRYCYAASGEKPLMDMPLEMMRAAIRLVARNAKRAGRTLQIGFHGGGEPTQHATALKCAVAYAKEIAFREGLKSAQFYIATNGVMSPDQREFVATEFSTINLSFDGPRNIQETARPTSSGESSYDAVMAFVHALHRHQRPFSIRSTITADNVRQMSRLVAFFDQATGCRLLHFEPAFSGGRCGRTSDDLPEWEVFAREFIQAWEEARKRRIDLRFSASRLEQPTFCFCGCANDPFTVTPDGYVTACYEVCDRDSPDADQYFFGRYSPDGFRFDFQKLAQLRQLTVHHKPLCARCFAKWICAGDCPVKSPRPYGQAGGQSDRCKMIQQVLRSLLERAVETTNPIGN